MMFNSGQSVVSGQHSVSSLMYMVSECGQQLNGQVTSGQSSVSNVH
jgi:hypothetical protein